jgi:pimeloyl-ACP methyl ester carboxylesterase
VLEEGIRRAHDQARYERIVVFGYSLGGVITRKALIWGHGLDEDRQGGGRRRLGKHGWVDKVERFVSLAAPNRGWRTDNPPEHLPFYMTATAAVLEDVTRLTGTAYLIRSVLAGSPFIANMRLQWVRLARERKDQMPLVVHLVGKRDELVRREDSLDLSAAPGVVFRTLPAFNHAEIGRRLYVERDGKRQLTEAGQSIKDAMLLKRSEFPAGWADPIDRKEDETIRRVIYIMHGIRDEGDWTDLIESRVMLMSGEARKELAIPSVRYKRFAMLPFLLYWDRQRNVRRFMDQYTEDVARYPNLAAVDFFGHSNGTYIVASALQTYHSLNVRNVLLAGSVVPSHYNWDRLIEARRVHQVRNIVADGDWVVALFPQLFETISQSALGQEEPSSGLFDIGAAGFRGFIRASADGGVQDIRFVSGQHGAAIDVVGVGLAEQKLDAISTFLARGDDKKLEIFKETNDRRPVLHLFSNVAWLVWLGILIALAGIGWLVARRLGKLALACYGILLIITMQTI